MKTKLLLLAPALILGTGLAVGGGTFALFSAHAANSSNTFAAGTLQIRLDHQDTDSPKVAYFNVANMAPGDSEIQPVTISSTGSLALYYTMSVTLGGFLGSYDPDHLIYAVYGSQSDAVSGANPIGLTSPRPLAAAGESGDHETLWVKITLPLNAGNLYQNQSGTAIITVNAEQQAHNTTLTVPQTQSSIQQLSDVPTVSGMSGGQIYGSDTQLSSIGPAPSGIWNTNNAGSSAPNGVPLLFSTVVRDTTGTLNIQFDTDDVSEVYLDGQPIWLEASWAQKQTLQLNVTPGYHTVQFFAENTLGQNPVTTTQSNNAVLNAAIADGNNATLSTTANPGQWSVQQPQAGAATFAPYLFGGSSQSVSGPVNPSDITWAPNANSGVPVGPATLPQ